MNICDIYISKLGNPLGYYPWTGLSCLLSRIGSNNGVKPHHHRSLSLCPSCPSLPDRRQEGHRKGLAKCALQSHVVLWLWTLDAQTERVTLEYIGIHWNTLEYTIKQIHQNCQLPPPCRGSAYDEEGLCLHHPFLRHLPPSPSMSS